MNILQTIIDTALAPIAVAVIVTLCGYMVPFLLEQRKVVSQHLGAERFSLAVGIASQVVMMIEQTMRDASGSEKKAAAIDALEAQLAAHGVDIEIDAAVALIEAQVYESLNKIESAIVIGGE